MRLLIVTKGLDIGGVERIVVDLAVGLCRIGVDVEVAIVNSSRVQLVGLLDAAGITVHRLDGSDTVGWHTCWQLMRLVASPRFDVVHVHGPLPSVVARLTPHARPVVTTSHTTWEGLRVSTRALWRATAWRDSATLAVSTVVERSLPRRRRTVTVLPHGVDSEAVVRALENARQSPRSPDSPVTAITLASHRDVKNYPNLLRAVSIAHADGASLRVVAVGTGPELDRHRRMAKDMGLSESVLFEPPTLEPLTAIARADFLVVASDFEGQPLVVSEALALGRPVVATAVGRVPELVNPQVGRVVPPGDPVALGHALAEVAGDEQLRKDLGSAAARQSGTWTLRDVIAAHLALYEQVLDSSARRGVLKV